jgi:hypothetical protein
MIGNLIDVLVELDDGKETTLLAKIEGEHGDTFVVRYMIETEQKVFTYENTTYTIDNSCVSGFYDSANEEDAGLRKVTGGWVEMESDSDYSCESESDSDTDESVTESEED